MRPLVFSFALSLFSFAAMPSVMAADPYAYETRGTLARAEEGQIASNIWSGVSRDEALDLVRAIPARMTSPVHYELARKFLLSDAPSLPRPQKQVKDKKAKSEEPVTKPKPDLLIARIDKLLELGALRDAQNLYDSVVDEPDDFDLAYRGLMMLMLRGQLSAACLDLQAMQYRLGGDPRWKEFNRFCRISFAAGPERDRLLADSKFEAMPILSRALRKKISRNAMALNTESLAYAVATGIVADHSVTALASRAGAMPPLLLTVLLSLDNEQAPPQRTCLAIEAVRRGLMGTRELITLYEKPHYDASLLLDEVGISPAAENIHPCLIPTVLYQRIASNIKTPKRDKAIREALNIMKDLPDAAFWPMALYFQEFDVKAAINKSYLWRVSRIVAYEKGVLPKEWLYGWGGEGGRGVSPFWPIQAVAHPTKDAQDELKIWRGQWPSVAKRVNTRDPIVPLLLSNVLTGMTPSTSEKGKNNVVDYENTFSLTFSRSYAMPSYGLTQKLADVIEKRQTGQSIALIMIGYGAIPPDQIIPHQMALVIDGMNKAGLAKYARRFALEVLQ